VLSGKCVVGGAFVGGPATPGDDCDHFFKFTNALARPDTIGVQLRWFSGTTTGGPDVDLYGLTSALGFCVLDNNCAGATTADPERMTVIIGAGQTFYIYTNLFDPKGKAAVLARIRVSGIG
jgi:hypothetical protein